MKKSPFIILICLFAFFNGQAQHFTHGLGISLMHDETRFSRQHPYFALAYTPGFTFMENKKYAFSINAPLRVGYASYYYNATYGNAVVSDDWTSYIVQLPFMFNFNYGAGSSQKSRNRVGFYGGAGYGIQYRTYQETYIDTYNNTRITGDSTEFSTGVALNGGVRFAVGRSYRRRNIEVGLAYVAGITGVTHQLFNVHALFNF
ncbi:hypothetical protein [Chitinophaga sp.]|uniref:hypothetical protein n=1 Tax=Chitinophaga sp. TaxID=1869181 RepID=UPI0031D563FF